MTLAIYLQTISVHSKHSAPFPRLTQYNRLKAKSTYFKTLLTFPSVAIFLASKKQYIALDAANFSGVVLLEGRWPLLTLTYISRLVEDIFSILVPGFARSSWKKILTVKRVSNACEVVLVLGPQRTQRVTSWRAFRISFHHFIECCKADRTTWKLTCRTSRRHRTERTQSRAGS